MSFPTPLAARCSARFPGRARAGLRGPALFEVAGTPEDAVALVEAAHRGLQVPSRGAVSTDALAEDWTAEPA